MIDIYNYCLNKNKTVFITSDMYLSKSVLKNMLKKIGVNGYDELFVSSEIQKTKSEGTLFSYITTSKNIRPQECVHIGDNKISDYKNARKAGWNAILINKYYQNTIYGGKRTDNLSNQIVDQVLNNYVLFQNDNNKLGFQIMGSLLYGFCIWLRDQLRNNNLKEVYFLARDDLIIKKAFDIINDGEFKTHYLYASRRVFQVPVLADNSITLSDYIGRLHWPAKVSIGYFLYALGIDSPIVKQRVSQKYGNLNYSIKREELHSSKLFQEIFDNEESEIRLNARDEKNSLVCYLKQENVIGKVAIVDIGWHGNMQYNLQTLLQNENIPNDIYGYYIGVKPNENKKDNVKMLGYIFDDHKNLDVFAREENINSLFEQIFMANHGSTKRLKYQTDGQIVPEFYSKEQINFEMTKLIMDYQTGALNFVMQMHKFDYYLQNLTSK